MTQLLAAVALAFAPHAKITSDMALLSALGLLAQDRDVSDAERRGQELVDTVFPISASAHELERALRSVCRALNDVESGQRAAFPTTNAWGARIALVDRIAALNTYAAAEVLVDLSVDPEVGFDGESALFLYEDLLQMGDLSQRAIEGRWKADPPYFLAQVLSGLHEGK